jgi:hypothetical protein
MVRSSPNPAMKFERRFRGSSGNLAVENLFSIFDKRAKTVKKILLRYR